jgi:hypothetical protein
VSYVNLYETDVDEIDISIAFILPINVKEVSVPKYLNPNTSPMNLVVTGTVESHRTCRQNIST